MQPLSKRKFNARNKEGSPNLSPGICRARDIFVCLEDSTDRAADT
jgi:hypothetical protein